ncbi:MAG: hypothetical protein V4736_06515 [Bdellovibrionota bacterium]
MFRNRSFALVTCFCLVCTLQVNAQIPPISEKTVAAAEEMNAALSTQINFETGAKDLSPDAAEKINTIMNEARKKGKVDHVKVIAWPDSEYPAKGTKVPRAEINLAQDRVKVMKRYLTNELKAGTVKTYNMAKRPTGLEKILKTPAVKVKDTLEASGSAPTSQEDTGVFGLDGKASQGLVLIYLKQ